MSQLSKGATFSKRQVGLWKNYLLYRYELWSIARYSLKELPLLKDSFFAFFDELEKYRPEAIVFLDLGARSLARPSMEALKILGLNNTAIRFINPAPIVNALFANEFPIVLSGDDLKYRYYLLFANLKQFKKILFVDETFHVGRGLATLRAASKFEGLDFRYFAFCKTGHTSITNFENATIVNKEISWGNSFFAQGSLALRELGRFYVCKKENGKTVPLNCENFPVQIFGINCACMNDQLIEKMIKIARLKAQKARVSMTKKVAEFAAEYKESTRTFKKLA